LDTIRQAKLYAIGHQWFMELRAWFGDAPQMGDMRHPSRMKIFHNGFTFS
jgi:hypothetical protein